MIIDTDKLKKQIKKYYADKVKEIDGDDTISEKSAIKKLNQFEQWENEKEEAINLVEHFAKHYKE